MNLIKELNSIEVKLIVSRALDFAYAYAAVEIIAAKHWFDIRPVDLPYTGGNCFVKHHILLIVQIDYGCMVPEATDT